MTETAIHTSSPPATKNGTLRVTIVGPVYPHRGGIAHYTACLAQALGERNCEVQLVGFRRMYPSWLFPGRSEFDPSGPPPQVASDPILTPLNPVRWMAAIRAIRRFGPDLVIFPWWHSWFFPCTSFCAAWLRWLQHRRIALLCHNVRSHDRAAVDRLAWGVLSRLPHAHIVHASPDPDRLRAMNPKARVVCVPHPRYDMFHDREITREEARRELGFHDEDEVCLCFGLVRHYKGLDVAIEAFGRIKNRPNLRLLVAGEFYEPRDRYDVAVKKLGIGDRVTIHDEYVPNERVAWFFRVADVLVAPYRAASHSGVVQIARAFRVPTIASNVGGLADLVDDGKTGLLVPPVDVDALASAIERFFAEGLAEPFRQNLEQEEGLFSWSDLAGTIRELAGASS